MRMMICGRSAAGKGTLISSLVTDQYADTFECVYIFSTTVDMDPLWKRVVKYIREELQQPEGTYEGGSLPIAYSTLIEQAIRAIMTKSKESIDK